MTALVSIFWAFLCPASHAGTVSLETDGAVEVQIGGATIARADGPGSLAIGELPAGPVTMRFLRTGQNAMDSTIQVSEEGITTVTLRGNTLTVQGVVENMRPVAQPIVILRPAENQSFTVVINDERRMTFDEEIIIENLEPGTHQIEFRSKDQLVVWVRGTLNLDPGDAIALTIEEGRMLKAEGAQNAWQPKAGH